MCRQAWSKVVGFAGFTSIRISQLRPLLCNVLDTAGSVMGVTRIGRVAMSIPYLSHLAIHAPIIGW
jgi:hypothetical protein